MVLKRFNNNLKIIAKWGYKIYSCDTMCESYKIINMK